MPEARILCRNYAFRARFSKLPGELLQECVDTFVVNAKDLGLIQTLGGSETLFPMSVLPLSGLTLRPALMVCGATALALL